MVTKKTASRKTTDAVFKALADPTRREILTLLREGRRSVGDIAANFRVSRPAISKHLRLLRKAGLVKDKVEGTFRMCELQPTPLKSVDAWLDDYKHFWDRSLARLKTLVENEP